MVLTTDDVLAARERTKGYLRRTPLLPPSRTEAGVWLKCEFLEDTGVFKARGAFILLLAARERGVLDPQAGVVIASGGNAGLATAYAAGVLRVPATVFVPSIASAVKVARLRDYGADVHVVGTEYSHAASAAADFARVRGALASHAYDLPEVVAGAGTLALEVLEDEPAIDTIVVALGGRARIVAVEPTLAPSLSAALAAGRPVDVEVSGVAADSLGARRVGEIAFAMATASPPISLLVDDEEIMRARDLMWRDYRIAAEAGAATAYAALTGGAYRPEPSERVALIVCGANTDPATLR